MELLLAIVMPVAFLASLISTGKWGLSTRRSLVIVGLSLVAAIIGLVLGQQYWMSRDRSGDASAIFASFLVGLLVTGPALGTIFYWAAIGFSRAYRNINTKP